MTESVISGDTREPQSSLLRLRRPGWWLMGGAFVIGLLPLAAFVKDATPVYRRHRAVTEIQKLGGSVRTRFVMPTWVWFAVGDRWKHGWDSVEAVEFSGRRPVQDSDLAWLPDLPEIQSLRFGIPKVTEYGVPPFSSMIDQRGVPIRFPRIGDGGMRYVKELKHLRRLSLSETQVGDAGLEQLSGLTELRFLGLDLTLVTDRGLTHLCGLKNLQGLSLFRVPVTDVGIPKLKCLPQLAHLYFHRVGEPEVTPPQPREEMYGGGVGILMESNRHLQVYFGLVSGSDSF